MLHVNNSLESETITSVFDIIIPINFMHHHRISNSKQIQSMIAILIPRIYFSIKGCCSTFNISAASKYIDRHLVAMCTVRLFVLLISKGQCARLASKRRFHWKYNLQLTGTKMRDWILEFELKYFIKWNIKKYVLFQNLKA